MCEHLYTRTSGKNAGIRCAKCNSFDSYAEAFGQVCACIVCSNMERPSEFVLDEQTLTANVGTRVLCLNCARKLRIVKYTLNEILCERGLDQTRQPIKRVWREL